MGWSSEAQTRFERRRAKLTKSLFTLSKPLILGQQLYQIANEVWNHTRAQKPT